MSTVNISVFSSHKSTYALIYKLFKKIPKKRADNICFPLADALMSFFAVFVLKFPSLLKFEEAQKERHLSSNMSALFGVKNTPSDTQMRAIVDKISPKYISSILKYLFNIIQRGKMLTDFEFTRKNGRPYYLVAVDGTEYFSSKEVSCNSCMIKNHRNETQTFYHQALAAVLIHPHRSQAIPLAVEGIMKSDGNKKNDCEYSAFKRLAAQIREKHPKLNIIICGDALYAKGDLVKVLHQYNMSYILNVKPKGNRKLFGHVGEYERKHGYCNYSHRKIVSGVKTEKTTRQTFRYVNGVRLNNANSCKDFKVNFLECREVKEWIGKRKKRDNKEKDIHLGDGHSLRR